MKLPLSLSFTPRLSTCKEIIEHIEHLLYKNILLQHITCNDQQYKGIKLLVLLGAKLLYDLVCPSLTHSGVNDFLFRPKKRQLQNITFNVIILYKNCCSVILKTFPIIYYLFLFLCLSFSLIGIIFICLSVKLCPDFSSASLLWIAFPFIFFLQVWDDFCHNISALLEFLLHLLIRSLQ